MRTPHKAERETEAKEGQFHFQRLCLYLVLCVKPPPCHTHIRHEEAVLQLGDQEAVFHLGDEEAVFELGDEEAVFQIGTGNMRRQSCG